MTLKGIDFTGIGILLGVAIVGVLGWQLYSHRQEIGRALNPGASGNLADRAASSIVSSATGGAAAGGEDSIGGLFARAREWLSGDDAKIEAMKRGSGTVQAPARTARELWGLQL